MERSEGGIGMRSRHWHFGWVAAVLLLIGGCATLAEPSTGDAWCNDQGAVMGLKAGMKVTGTYTETYDVQRTYPETNSNTLEAQKTVLKVVLDLTVQEDGSTLKGTGKVTWQRNNRLEFRQNPGVCADGMMIDSNVREWTVDLTGNSFCDGEVVGVMASGSPDGGDIATTLHYHDYGCHTGCSCYDNTTGTNERVRWNSFVARGFVDTHLSNREDMTPPSPFTGEWSRVTELLLSGE